MKVLGVLVTLITTCSTSAFINYVSDESLEVEKSSFSKVTHETCSHGNLFNFLDQMATLATDIARLTSLGKSVEGRDIWSLVISDNTKPPPTLRPQVKIVGNINGVSGSACFVILKLIEVFVQGYEEGSEDIKEILYNMELHLVPNLNPDGYANTISGSCFKGDGKFNANGVFLNRDFPDFLHPTGNYKREAETEAIMQWISQNNFMLSLSLIAGAWVVTYPFDSVPGIHNSQGVPHLTPDNDIFENFAYIYASSTPYTSNIGYCDKIGKNFQHGITNGAAWSATIGTMQDYNYFQGTFELMIGVACCRNENDLTELEKIWFSNQLGIFQVLKKAHLGIRGQVIDSATKIPLSDVMMKRTEVQVQHSIPMPWFTNAYGEFWRPLLPGLHHVEVQKDGFKLQTVSVNVLSDEPTYVYIELEKLPDEQYASEVIDVLKVKHNMTNKIHGDVETLNFENSITEEELIKVEHRLNVRNDLHLSLQGTEQLLNPLMNNVSFSKLGINNVQPLESSSVALSQLYFFTLYPFRFTSLLFYLFIYPL